MRRRVIAIGDLHGDVHRLVRILERQEVLLPGTRKWKRAANHIDVVLLGDYVDWRGETLEGDRATWDHGVCDLLDLIIDLHKQVDEFRSTARSGAPRFFSLVGNHDKMMLDAYRHLTLLSPQERDTIATAHADTRVLKTVVAKPPSFLARMFGGKQTPDKKAEALITWMANGGPSTIRSYGGFNAWYERMKAGLALFIEQKMPLGVVINDRLYSHSVPDTAECWRPVDQVARLGAAERDAITDEWIWGRRISGFDQKTGKKIAKPAEREVDQMLSAMNVKGVVVGHSLMQSLVPIRAYEGKVVNIDLHGHPMSDPWLDEYEG